MSMPDPPWGPARRGARERTPLSADRIVDTALELIAQEGYDAVTMRRIARALDTGPSSLYAHVTNKRQLDQMLIDRIIEGIDLPAPDPDHWQEQVKEFGRTALELMRAYPGVARAAIGNVPVGPNAVRTMETLLGYLRAGGLSDHVVAGASDLLPLYVTAVAYEQSVRARDGESESDVAAQLSEYFAALPPERFPHMVAMSKILAEVGDDVDPFEFGLDVLVSGLAAVAAREHP